jgi:hypothetical protein
MLGALRRRPSAAMIVAVLALVTAASGTAVAAGHLTAGDKLIKKHSLSGNRLRNGTITGKQLDLAQLGKVPSATAADHATTADQATSATTAGSASLSRVVYQSTTVPFSDSGPVAGTATCPAGLDVIAGGAKVSSMDDDFIIDTAPTGHTGWEASGVGDSGETMVVSAICAPVAQTTP